METKKKSTLVVVSKDDQKAVATDIFKHYPKSQKVSVASDGQAFITDEGEGAAKNHAKNNRYGKELDLTPFTRDGINAPAVSITEVEDTDTSKKVEPSNTTK
jgi:hypothetical protein